MLELLTQNPYLALFVIIGAGLLLGNLQIQGISLGSSGVIFIALLAGHFGITLPSGIGSLGLMLFVYCVGIGAGGRFFSALKQEGSQLAQLAFLVVAAGALTTYLLALIFNLDAALAVGIFAGAMTSTPALAAATEGAKELADSVVVGYGIAYPLGVIGIVLFVQLLPKWLKQSLDDGAEDTDEPVATHIVRRLVQTTNTTLFGRKLEDSHIASLGAVQVTRVWQDNRLRPVSYDETFEEGKLFLLVGNPEAVATATEHIGQASDRRVVIDADNERREVVVTSGELIGKCFAELPTLKHYGVTITRISRLEFTFVPNRDTRIEKADRLTVVGEPERLNAFEKTVGHRSDAFPETSLVSLAIGLALGILVGRVALPLPWGETFSLGLAGGPLLVALLLGHFGRVGNIIGYIPRPTRVLLQEMGLVFFLADSGIRGGLSIAEALETQGIKIFFIGAMITLVPMLVGYFAARRWFGLGLGNSLGGICGGMTSTPALGAIVAKTSRQAPITSYATVYPVAIILMALFAKLLLQLM